MRYVRDLQVGRYYKLVNVNNQQRILDLSGPYGGSTAVTGFMSYGGDNQKWELQGDGRGFTLRNAHFDLYLAFEGHVLSKDDYPRGTKAIGSSRPFLWNIQKRNEDQMNSNFQEPARFRLSTSGLKKHLDLDYYTHSKVHLIEDTGHRAQLWYFEEVADVDHTRPVIYSDMLTELVEVKISEQAIAVDRQVAGTKVNNTRIVE